MQGISLKAQLELQRQVYRKSAKILTLQPSSNSGDAPSLAQPSSHAPDQVARSVAMLSNMGCVQHAQHKHSTAALCFSQALRKCAQLPSQVHRLPSQVDRPTFIESLHRLVSTAHNHTQELCQQRRFTHSIVSTSHMRCFHNCTHIHGIISWCTPCPSLLSKRLFIFPETFTDTGGVFNPVLNRLAAAVVFSESVSTTIVWLLQSPYHQSVRL